MPKRRRRKKKHFTLIELMVVLAIGGILLAILLPAFREAAEKKRAEESLQVTGMPEETVSPNGKQTSNGCGSLFLGFVLGVGATLFYQRRRSVKAQAVRSKSGSKAQDTGHPSDGSGGSA